MKSIIVALLLFCIAMSCTQVIASPGLNMPPVAIIGEPYSVEVGESIYFDASGSTDDNDSIISYRWDFGDSVGGVGISVTHSYNEAGNYTVLLTVTDDEGLSNTQNTTVTVRFEREKIDDNVQDDISWLYWTIGIIGIIILIVIYIMSKYELER